VDRAQAMSQFVYPFASHLCFAQRACCAFEIAAHALADIRTRFGAKRNIIPVTE